MRCKVLSILPSSVAYAQDEHLTIVHGKSTPTRRLMRELPRGRGLTRPAQLPSSDVSTSTLMYVIVSKISRGRSPVLLKPDPTAASYRSLLIAKLLTRLHPGPTSLARSVACVHGLMKASHFWVTIAGNSRGKRELLVRAGGWNIAGPRYHIVLVQVASLVGAMSRTTNRIYERCETLTGIAEGLLTKVRSGGGY
jgi:hypothetical protein